MSESKHKPLPWATAKHPGRPDNTDLREVTYMSPFGRTFICEAHKDDADFIALAANAHDALVEALRKLMDATGDMLSGTYPDLASRRGIKAYENAASAAEAALALAKAEGNNNSDTLWLRDDCSLTASECYAMAIAKAKGDVEQ